MGKSKQHRRFQQLELFPKLYPSKEEIDSEEIKNKETDTWKVTSSGLYPWHENEDGEEVQEWPGLDAINKEWV